MGRPRNPQGLRNLRRFLYLSENEGVAVCIETALWMSEWVIKFKGLLGTADIGVHVVHIIRVIMTYTFESLSSLPYITQNIQVTINSKKKKILKKSKTKKWGHPLSWLVIGDGNSTSVNNYSKHLTSFLSETKPHTAITNKPGESNEKIQL